MKGRDAVSWFTANKDWTIPLTMFVVGVLLGLWLAS